MIFFKRSTNEEAPSSAFSSPMQVEVNFKVETVGLFGLGNGIWTTPPGPSFKKTLFVLANNVNLLENLLFQQIFVS